MTVATERKTARELAEAAREAAENQKRKTLAAVFGKVGPWGTPIVFAIQHDADEKWAAFVFYKAVRGDTCRRIAAAKGRPELATKIASMNHIRSTTAKITPGRKIRLPGILKDGASFAVLPQDETSPTITDGYAQFTTVSRPGAKGVSQFTGYNPLTMPIPVDFMATQDHSARQVEDDCALLERMAGRGPYRGAGRGAPAIIRVSVFNNKGKLVPLIPAHYQWSPTNKSAPLWRIGGGSGGGGGIDWDASPRRTRDGHRIRQLATITLVEHTGIHIIETSPSGRSRGRQAGN